MLEMQDVIYETLQLNGLSVLNESRILKAFIADLAPLKLSQSVSICIQNLNGPFCNLLFQGAMGDQRNLADKMRRCEVMLRRERGLGQVHAENITGAFYKAICRYKGYETSESRNMTIADMSSARVREMDKQGIKFETNAAVVKKETSGRRMHLLDYLVLFMIPAVIEYGMIFDMIRRVSAGILQVGSVDFILDAALLLIPVIFLLLAFTRAGGRVLLLAAIVIFTFFMVVLDYNMPWYAYLNAHDGLAILVFSAMILMTVKFFLATARMLMSPEHTVNKHS